jgi:hypothetical protein
MKKYRFPLFIKVFSLIAALFWIVSCDKTDNDFIHNNELSIGAAKAWFEQTHIKNARNGEKDTTFDRRINWDDAFDYQFSPTQKIVALPIFHQKKGDTPSGYKQLWIYKDKFGSNRAVIAEYVWQFDKKDKNELLNRKFSGYMLFRDWDNNLLGGFSIKNDKILGGITEFSLPKDVKSKKNKRLNNYTCYWAPNCRTAYVGAVYEGQEILVSILDCSNVNYVCVYSESLGFNTGPTAPHWIPVSTGGSSPITLFPNDFKYETIPNKCSGYERMWQIGYRDNSPMLTKEVSGFLTSDNQVIVAPTFANNATTAHFSNIYHDSQGRIIINFDEEMGRIWVFNHTNNTAQEYSVKGLIHTHPYCNGSFFGAPYLDDQPSDQDYKAANQAFYSRFEHYIISCSNIIKFDGTGPQSVTKTPRTNCR